ncbi:hypothetical protein F2P47_16515 [Parvibaculum sedimenti]|uniref:Type II secretion system protein GspF domain-containing protein n=1 Tax=Parvibaculum sedimenti TaxID=2608632 RepID=A0A6N6VFZ9_9HYPH|nr:type II secretion system F family protein [Parvibaculum sedimenti]KAB7738612.1 hypothetical protein F2P47_16515 [Parvibaculum sedimenti]
MAGASFDGRLTVMLQILTVIVALFCFIAGAAAVAVAMRERRVAAAREKLLTLVQPERSRDQAATTIHSLPDMDKILPLWLRRRVFQAGIEIDKRRFTLVSFGVLGLFSILLMIFGLVVTCIAGVTVAGIIIAVIDFIATRRMNALSGTMSGFLDRVRQLLVVGNSLSVALSRATQSSPPILVEFLMPSIRRIANGAGVSESINQLAEDLDQNDLWLFGAAIDANMRFGGSLTAVLANLIETMRRRAAVDREIRANTSQTRASAWILGLLPLVVVSIVMVTNPSYVRYFIDEPMGHKFLIYVFISEAIGAFLMRSIVRVNY